MEIVDEGCQDGILWYRIIKKQREFRPCTICGSKAGLYRFIERSASGLPEMKHLGDVCDDCMEILKRHSVAKAGFYQTFLSNVKRIDAICEVRSI